MPPTRVVFYQEKPKPGRPVDAPIVDWLRTLNETIARKAAFIADPKAHTYTGEIEDV